MKKSIYKVIRDQLEDRRKKALEEKERRKEEIYKNLPEIKEIDDRIRSLGIKTGLASIRGVDIGDIEDEISSLIDKKKDMLRVNGYQEDYQEDVYQCKICSDRGYLENNLKCNCFKNLLISYLLDQSNLSPSAGTLKDFDFSLYPDQVNKDKYKINNSPRKHMRAVYARCLNFVENFSDKDNKNLLFIGQTGLGKTFMCNSIAIELLEKGIPVLYLSAPEIFNKLSMRYSNDELERERSKELSQLVEEVELLIIDDLGTEKQTAARYTELLEILNARELRSRKDVCKTIISTNLEPSDIYQYYGERVASRLIGDYNLLYFVGDDIRLKRK